MNPKIKNIYKSHLLDFYTKLNPSVKVTDKLFKCICTCSLEPTMQHYQNRFDCVNPSCRKSFDIFDYVRFVKPQFKDSVDSDIAEYLSHTLKIVVADETPTILKQYQQAGFALIPLIGGHADPKMNKVPIKGSTGWEKTSYKDISLWNEWIERGYNIGLNLGAVSAVIAVDIDSDETYEKVKHMLGETLIQTTGRGKHYIYNYDPDFKKTLNKVLRDDGYEMELRTNNSYCVVAPSATYPGEIRRWNNGKITDMPKELKEFLLKYQSKGEVKTAEVNEAIQDSIDNEKVDVVDLTGQRNVTFVKLAGIFRKKLTTEQTSYVLNVISNSLIDKPIPQHELKAILGQVSKYNTYDKVELSKLILSRLDIVKESTAYQLASSLKLEQKDVEDVLAYLEKESKIIALPGNRYKKLITVDWQTNLTDEINPIDFVVPYFSKYAFFNWKELIVIGGQTGSGKTVVVGNLMKSLIEQKITPYLVSTEATSTIGKTLNKLGVLPGQYKYKITKSIMGLELPDNGVIILDWLGADAGDYSKMAVMYEHLHEQVKKHNCFLIVMEQLRKDNGNFFAQNLNMFYASLVAKYQYGSGGTDNINTFFKTEKIRDSKTGQQYVTIPTVFNPENRSVKLREVVALTTPKV